MVFLRQLVGGCRLNLGNLDYDHDNDYTVEF